MSALTKERLRLGRAPSPARVAYALQCADVRAGKQACSIVFGEHLDEHCTPAWRRERLSLQKLSNTVPEMDQREASKKTDAWNRHPSPLEEATQIAQRLGFRFRSTLVGSPARRAPLNARRIRVEHCIQCSAKHEGNTCLRGIEDDSDMSVELAVEKASARAHWKRSGGARQRAPKMNSYLVSRLTAHGRAAPTPITGAPPMTPGATPTGAAGIAAGPYVVCVATTLPSVSSSFGSRITIESGSGFRGP